MAAPIIPILKKLAVSIVSDKKLLKKVLGIVLGIIVFAITPMLAVIGIFSQLVDISTSEMEEILSEYETTASAVCAEIEKEMSGLGYPQEKIEEAQALYAFALFDFGEEDGFVGRLVGCYSLEEQTDEEVIAKVNETFGTEYFAEEYTALMEEIRDRQVLDETENKEDTA